MSLIRKLALLLLLLAAPAFATAPFLSTGSGILGTGTGPLATGSVVTFAQLGLNTNAIGYANGELPFLNIVKQGGQESGNFPYEPWLTMNGGSDTGEEAKLTLDSDQYPTTLTGGTFTSLRMYLNVALPVPPGVTYPYATAGTVYRLQATGKTGGGCTITIGGDGSATLSPTSGATVSTTFTVATPSSTGLQLGITAITSPGCNNISVVENAYASSYDAGAIFHPKFLAALAGTTLVRPMQWTMMFGHDEILSIALTGSVSSGATSATLAGVYFAGGNQNAPWQWPTTTIPVVFSDGEQKNVTFTLGSSTISWTGGLTNTVGGSPYSPWPYSSWATRPVTTQVSYSTVAGVPFEIDVALANALTADVFINEPIWFSDADDTSLSTLVHSTLGSTQRAYPEKSNEVWNAGTYPQFGYAGYLGAALWPGQPAGGSNYNYSRNYFGMRTAQMAANWQTVWGSDFSRVYPTLGTQAANTTQTTDAMTTAYWTSGPASGYPIKVIAIDPYFGNNNTGALSPYPTQADTNTLTSQGDGGLTCFFSLMTTNVGSCGTLSSVPSTGFLGYTEASLIANNVALLAANYPSVKLATYEGGTSFLNGGAGGGPPTGWQALITTASRDSRMQNVVKSLLDYWATTVGSGRDNPFAYFVDVYSINSNGDFGLLESTQQTLSGVSKYQGWLLH